MTSKYKGFVYYLNEVSFAVTYTANVDWSGNTPGYVEFKTPKKTYIKWQALPPAGAVGTNTALSKQHNRLLCLLLLLCISIVGSVPSQLCNDVFLTKLHVYSNPLTCYASCLTSKLSLGVGTVPRCPTSQELGLCGFIAATNIQNSMDHTMWSCNKFGFTNSNPCLLNNHWSGIVCSNGTIISISLINKGVVGTISHNIKYLHSLTHFTVKSNSLFGTMPLSMNELLSLRTIDISNNLFNGKFPNISCNIQNFASLHFENTSIICYDSCIMNISDFNSGLAS